MRDKRYFEFVKELFGDIKTITPYSYFFDETKNLKTDSIKFTIDFQEEPKIFPYFLCEIKVQKGDREG